MTDIASRHVVHVVDRFTGGVKSAVDAYIQNSPPGHRHTVVTLGEPSGTTWANDESLVQVRRVDLPSSLVFIVPRLRRAIKKLRPDAVHAHSSVPGAIVRLALSPRKWHIVYTAHCFAFEREDLSAPMRQIYRTVEHALARRTTVFAGCSRREVELFERFGAVRARSVEVPNVASVPRSVATGDGGDDPADTVGMSGRLAPQKDADYFERVLASMRSHRPVHGVWIGSGDLRSEERLSDLGVHVTGWLDPQGVAQQLDGLSLYLHTARWEGFPVAVLDAHQRGVPILVRQIPAFSHVPPALTIEDGLASFLETLPGTEDRERWITSNVAGWGALLARHTPEFQRDALASAWRTR